MKYILALFLITTSAQASEWWYNGRYYADNPKSITIDNRGILNPNDSIMVEVAVPAQSATTPAGMVKIDSAWTEVDGVMVETGTFQTQEEYDAEIEQARQDAKPLALKSTENEFFDLCEQLGFTGKPGFDELSDAIATLQATDPMAAISLSIKLLSIDAAGKRYSATWWDSAQKHESAE